MSLSLNELPLAARRKALEQAGRKRGPRRSQFPKDRARTYAIRVLAVVAELTPAARGRVLRIAQQMNEV